MKEKDDVNVRSAREVALFLIVGFVSFLVCAGVGSVFVKNVPHATDVVQPPDVGSPH